MKKLAFLVLFCIAGCSSVRQMRGTEAKPVGEKAIDKLMVTFEPAPNLSLENYRLLNIYFRNRDEEWLQVKRADIVSVAGAPHFKVVVGKDLKAWQKSMALDIDLRLDHEKNIVQRARLLELKDSLEKYKEDDYIYGPFRLPSMLQTQKWLLLQVSRKETVMAVTIQLTFMDESKQSYTIEAGEKP